MLIKIRQFEFDRFYKLQNLLKVEFISMHVRGGHIFVYGGVLSVTECIFLFTGGRAYKLGVGGGGLIIGSLRYLFFGISFYRMRFRHICSFSLRPLLAVGVKVWKRSTWRIISHLVHTGCPKCTFPIQCSWSPCDFNGSFGHSCPEYLDCIQCCDSCGNYECVPPGGPPSS